MNSNFENNDIKEMIDRSSIDKSEHNDEVLDDSTCQNSVCCKSNNNGML